MGEHLQGSEKMALEDMIHLLERILRICSHASLTGCLSDGKDFLIIMYNELLQGLNERGLLPKDSALSNPMNQEANIGEIGCATSLILTLLKRDKLV